LAILVAVLKKISSLAKISYEPVVSSSDMTASRIADLIDSHAAALCLYARQWCACPEDVVQVAFCKLASQSAWPDDPPAWLFKVVRNAALDAAKSDRRRRKREEKVARPVHWFQEASIDGIDAAVAVSALEALPAELREVIIARLWGDLSLAQISELMDCSITTTYRRFEAGILAIRERLGVICAKS
jgi:RNA polymerase sigma factor (sigma-70 family)